MFSQKRMLLIFELLSQENTKVNCRKLSEKLKVTERTIRTDINSMNSTLDKHGAVIKLKRGQGYSLEITDLNLYQEFLALNSEELMDTNEIPDSPLERTKFILKSLLYNDDYIKVDEIADSLYVSKVTILNDIKKVKTVLSKYRLSLLSKPYHGLKINGSETDIRKCISDNLINRDFENYLIEFTDDEKSLFKGINLDKLQNAVLNSINKADVEFSDFNLKNFIIHTAITISRILHGNSLDNFDVSVSDFSNNSPVIAIFSYIEKTYNIEISKADKMYLFNHYTSKSKSLNDDLADIDSRIVNYTTDLLSVIKDTYNLDLTCDSVLYHDLLLHFKSILNSKYYNLNKTNPLLNTIKSNYPLAFEITFSSVQQVFKNSMYTFNEDEVGYVSLHIGAAIERFFQNNIKQKNAVIVCGSGYGTSRLLEAQINKLFHDKIKIVECLSFNNYKTKDLKNIDIILSTIPITHSRIPVVIVDIALMQKDIEMISKTITNSDGFSDKVIDEYFDKRLFIKSPNVSSKEDLLRLMCSKLNENEIVFPSFIDSVLYRESLSSTNIDDFLAIPHPMELKSTRTKICTAILDEPLLWNKDTSVQVVMMLAINKSDYFEMDSVYDIFLKIINDISIKNELIKCTSYNDFISILRKIL